MLRRILTILILVLIAGKAFPAHIIGGEIYYECLGGDLYRVTMKLFRDCNSGGAEFDEPASFSIFNESNYLVMTKSVYIYSVEDIDPDLSSPCLIFPPDICVQEGIYKFNVQLPSNTQAYKIVYQRCCRNATIQNLTNPGDQGLTIVAEVPAFANAECNSMPSYNNFPPPVLCAQESLSFDHSATDLDGDSLAYSLCSPFIGGTPDFPAPNPASNPPFNQVLWGPDFSAEAPLNANPGLSIDPITGLLTGKPTQLGQFVVGVCVEEWRNGQLLSINTRDFQFNVAYCEQTFTAIIADPAPEDLCGNLTMNFENLSDPDNEFVWDFGDPGNPQVGSTIYSPTYTFSDTGTYEIMLITNPGFFCSDTAYLVLPLYYEMHINVEIASFECVDGEQVFNFAADGEFDEGATLNWNFGPNATPQTGTGLEVEGIRFSTLGPQEIDVEALDNVCEAHDQVIVDIPEPPNISINPQEIFCDGLHYQFSKETENANIFHWDFGVDGIDTDISNQPNPGFTFPEPGVYTVSLTANSAINCPVTVTETFEIRTLLAPKIGPNDIQCLAGNSVSFEATGSFTPQAVFAWEFAAANPGTSNQQNPSGISFESAGTHDVQLTISENGCTRSAESEMRIHGNPIADFKAGKFYGCAPLTLSFVDQSYTQSSSVSYLFDFGDGNQSNARIASHTYTQPGVYSVHLFLQNLNGCIDSDDEFKEALVEVVPTPKAGFKADPLVVSVLDPVIEIIDLSEGSTSCEYRFDDQVFEDCNFEHVLNNVEAQMIYQTVENEYGCKASSETQIRISDHLIYIPNSFTPDSDGLNDLFYPVAIGAINIEMQIYDRWGHIVYGNKNDTQGWNGSSPNKDYYAPAGVYQYFVVLTDNLGWNFEYTGSVRLLR